MRYGKWTRSLMAVAGLIAVFTCAQAASPDPYLQMLDEEAGKLEMINNAERLDAASMTRSGSIQENDQAQPSLVEGLTQEQFEKVLKARFVGTNLLYEKLPKNKRQDVYASYQRDSRVMEIRKAIVNHMQGEN